MAIILIIKINVKCVH